MDATCNGNNVFSSIRFHAMRCDAIRFGCIRLDLDFRPCGGPKPKNKKLEKIETKKWRTILLIDSLAKRTAAGPTKAKSRKV